MNNYLTYLFSSDYLIWAAICLVLFGAPGLLLFINGSSAKATASQKSMVKNKGCLFLWLSPTVIIPLIFIVMALVDANIQFKWNNLKQKEAIETAKMATLCVNPNIDETGISKKNIKKVLVIQRGGFMDTDVSNLGWTNAYQLSNYSDFPFQIAKSLVEADAFYCLDIDYSSTGYTCTDTLNVNSDPVFIRNAFVSIKLISWPEGVLLQQWDKTDVSQYCFSGVDETKLINIIQNP